jgi:hypothetical protein
MSSPGLIVVSRVGGGQGAPATAHALAIAAARREAERSGEPGAALLLDGAGGRASRAGLLATEPARALRERVAELMPALRPVARGHLCLGTIGAEDDPHPALEEALAAPLSVPVVAHLEPASFREATRAAARRVRLAVLQSDSTVPKALLALAFAELRADGVPLKVKGAAPGRIQARRALAGLEPGGATGTWARRALAAGASPRPPGSGRLPRLSQATGQVLPLVLGLVAITIIAALAVAALGGAATAKGRAQRGVDLAALAAARSMREDFPRLFLPPGRTQDGPEPLAQADYRRHAVAAAREAARRNDLPERSISVRFEGRDSIVPLRVSVRARPRIVVGGAARGRTSVAATAALDPPAAALGPPETTASGGGYSGPLAYRQGKPMRPDVAAAFDRLSAAAGRAGLSLIVNSGFRSDAQQARLYAANPDPRWVAPPGRSLHRCGTELDLGPPAAYGWLARHAARFGFARRYDWEAWHFGYERGPAPCSAAAERGGTADAGRGDGRRLGAGGLPRFVPAPFRDSIARAAASHGVSAALLAAQLLAESNFDPRAVSPTGARGIAQFMPATAAAYGLADPFDAGAAIDAQARLMADLLDRFGSARLALAAYNAGPAPVAACGCVPPYPETQAYVARIIGLLGGLDPAGGPPPTLEVRLVE